MLLDRETFIGKRMKWSVLQRGADSPYLCDRKHTNGSACSWCDIRVHQDGAGRLQVAHYAQRNKHSHKSAHMRTVGVCK